MHNLAVQIAVHVFVHATAILLVAWLANQSLPGWPAASQHAVWTTAFAVLLLLPLGYGILPGWELGIIPPATSDEGAVDSTVSSVPVAVSPEEGSHQLCIRSREDGTRLRRLRITNRSASAQRVPPP